MRPTTDSRDGVERQVPGLRPPAYKRAPTRRQRPGPPGAPGSREAGGDKRGKGTHPARLLWDGLALAKWETRLRHYFTGRSGIGPGGRRPRPPPKRRHSGRPPFTFIAPLGLVRPMTRTHVRLLGPCFKTGRVGHRPFARRERMSVYAPLCCTTVAGQPGHRRFPPSPARRREAARHVGVPVHPGLRRPQQRVAATYITRGNTPADAGSDAGTPKSSWVASANPDVQPALADELNPLGSTFEVPPVWLLTVSRTLELSLQSSFQLSLTVLVRYRSRGHI